MLGKNRQCFPGRPRLVETAGCGESQGGAVKKTRVWSPETPCSSARDSNFEVSKFSCNFNIFQLPSV